MPNAVFTSFLAAGGHRIAEFGSVAAHASGSNAGPTLLFGALAIVVAVLARFGLAWLFTRRRRRAAAADDPSVPDGRRPRGRQPPVQ